MVSITREHLITEIEIPPNFAVVQSTCGEVYVDTDMTAELEAEGYARELVRHVQQARKEMGLTKEQPIAVTLVIPQQMQLLKNAVSESAADVKLKVGAFKLEIAETRPEHGKFDSETVARIKGQNVEIFLVKG